VLLEPQQRLEGQLHISGMPPSLASAGWWSARSKLAQERARHRARGWTISGTDEHSQIPRERPLHRDAGRDNHGLGRPCERNVKEPALLALHVDLLCRSEFRINERDDASHARSDDYDARSQAL